MSEPLTATAALLQTTFSEYRKTALTRISDDTFPPGTVYQTPEGLRAEDEDTRCAFDVQGGIYPIRESVFQASYTLAAARDRPGLDVSEPLRHEAEFIASGRISSSPRIRAFANAVLATLDDATLDAAREGPGLPKEYRIRSNGIDYIAFRRDEWTAREGQGLDETPQRAEATGDAAEPPWQECGHVHCRTRLAAAQQREGAGVVFDSGADFADYLDAKDAAQQREGAGE